MENENIPEVFKPDARSSLGTAKTFLSQAVEAMLANGQYEHAKETIDVLARVDRIMQNKQIQHTPSLTDTRFTQDEVNMILQGRKIDAIKKVRERTGYGLKEAKDLVESFRAE